MTDNILATVSSIGVGEEVELYILDLAPIGVNLKLNFTPSNMTGPTSSIWYGGVEFLPRAIYAEGFEKSSQDAPPEPTLTLGNADKGGNALLKTYGDLLGVKLTRIVTFSQFLDKLADGVTANPTADSSAMLLPEIWYIEQKTGNTPIAITFRLKSVLDLNGKQIPKRLILKDVCTRSYRTWDATAGVFRYATKNACPFADPEMYDRQGVVTTDPTEDECSKDYKGCSPRFKDDPLPGWFFPGVTRLPR